MRHRVVTENLFLFREIVPDIPGFCPTTGECSGRREHKRRGRKRGGAGVTVKRKKSGNKREDESSVQVTKGRRSLVKREGRSGSTVEK